MLAMLALLLAADPAATAEPAAAPPPAVRREDTPEEIAKDAARDLADNHYYNRPGATRADYDADWQACRLIARGSVTPSGYVPVYYYQPGISPLASGIGTGIGLAIGEAIAEGQRRRANRGNCLLIRGWRKIDVDPAEAKRIAALPPGERDAMFAEAVGAEKPPGARAITAWHNDFAAPRLAPEAAQ